MNRMLKRLKQHPCLPILYPSKKRILDKKVKKSAFKSIKGKQVSKGARWRESRNNEYK